MRLYSRAEAAEKLGISPATLDLIRHRGQISYIQSGPNRKVFFSEANLDEYVKRCTHHAIPVHGQNEKTR